MSVVVTYRHGMVVERIDTRTGWREYLAGFRLGIPIFIASGPFGILFGALAVQQGMTIGETLFMSATIYAGASQMVGLDLFGQRIAPWVIVLSIFAVNFRHVLYSAAIGRLIGHWSTWQKAVGFFFLVDPQYAESERRAESGRQVDFRWYLGIATPVYLMWIVTTWLGAAFGRLIPNPEALGLDFLLPIYFLGLLMGFRQRPLWLPTVIVAGAASIVAYLVVGSPWHVSIGALAGIVLAAAMPLRESNA